MKKSELKKAYYERINALNTLKSQNVILKSSTNLTTKESHSQLDIYLAFANSTAKEETTKQYDDALTFITDLSMHERYTISIIKSIASNPCHHTNKACLDIVNSGYTQHILDDIKQEVFIELFNMVNSGKCWLENNELVFDTYINKNDIETSYYTKLYNVIENFFYNEKKQNETRYIKIKYDVEKHGTKAHFDEKGYLCDRFGTPYKKGVKMEYIDSYNDDVTSVNSSNYKKTLCDINGENGLKNVSFNADVKSFFRYIKNHYPKYYKDFCNIFYGLYNGYSYKEIALSMGTTERRIKYLVPLFREKFHDIVISGITPDVEKHNSIYCDTTRNKGNKNYTPVRAKNVLHVNSIKTKSGRRTTSFDVPNNDTMFMYTPNFRVSHKEEKTIFDAPNYEYLMPEYIIKAWRKEEEELKKALHDNSTRYINLVNARNNCIVIINENGDTLYNVPYLSNTLTIEKFAKKHGLEIL